MYWRCIGDVLEMYWRCIGDVLELEMCFAITDWMRNKLCTLSERLVTPQ
jgi:hypothetical protein